MSDERIDLDKLQLLPEGLAHVTIWRGEFDALVRELRDARQTAATAAALRCEVANLRNSQQIAAPSPRHYRELVAERDDLRERLAEGERLNRVDRVELRDARAEAERLREYAEQKRGGQVGYFAAAMALEAERDDLRAKLAAAERELAVSEREVVRVRGYFTAATEAERVAVVERDAAERQLAAARKVCDRLRDYHGGFDQIRQERKDIADVIDAALSSGGTE